MKIIPLVVKKVVEKIMKSVSFIIHKPIGPGKNVVPKVKTPDCAGKCGGRLFNCAGNNQDYGCPEGQIRKDIPGKVSAPLVCSDKEQKIDCLGTPGGKATLKLRPGPGPGKQKFTFCAEGKTPDCYGICGGRNFSCCGGVGCDQVPCSGKKHDCSGTCGGDKTEDCTGTCGGNAKKCSRSGKSCLIHPCRKGHGECVGGFCTVNAVTAGKLCPNGLKDCGDETKFKCKNGRCARILSLGNEIQDSTIRICGDYLYPMKGYCEKSCGLATEKDSNGVTKNTNIHIYSKKGDCDTNMDRHTTNNQM